MKILAIADRPPKQSINKILSSDSVDLIITLGDLDFFDLKELKDINDIPKIGVYGNHCSGKYFESLGIKNMHLQTWEFQGITFGGFEGSLKYKNSNAIMYTQDEASRLLEDFPKVDVLLAHSPPYGINDEPGDPTHTGLVALKKYIEKNQPKYFLHGHTYPDNSEAIQRIGQTQIIYIYQDKIVNL